MNRFFAKALKSDFYNDPVLKQNLNEAYKMYTDKILPNYKKIFDLYVQDHRDDIGDMAVEMERVVNISVNDLIIFLNLPVK